MQKIVEILCYQPEDGLEVEGTNYDCVLDYYLGYLQNFVIGGWNNTAGTGVIEDILRNPNRNMEGLLMNIRIAVACDVVHLFLQDYVRSCKAEHEKKEVVRTPPLPPST